ncbi:metallophosphoesterase family protein [Komagataeibacter rhaeticus]|uniref:metallophosphoesterase family protein n=1 Tax=Komagataeibacter rhaeticus TaxID=215221 RepID=UPI000DA1551F|nr:DNA repair exonuclease [Komagataeibacter rhaeticus]MBL7241054.1 DNA repair exonuclease [Komagataeibacter rhaeticus]GBQ14533.1 metallophosphoesterase [Komagataeibacter rhaeticus DSM 16663]
MARMDEFRFLHAADLHLDSPLRGLTEKSGEYARLVADASRRAFSDMVSLAIESACRFVVLAGDVFDGDLRDTQCGLFFISGMARLRAAGIRVFMILGNHDAENRFARHLRVTDNVHLFATTGAETCIMEDLGVAVHGHSFGRRDVRTNIARQYPPPVAGLFNIGILHTACQGREGHETYAPCTVEQLVNHGYQYWALGHVHTREILHRDPYVVYAGNLQGRHAREAGPKGASLVTVRGGAVATVEHRVLDAVRWACESVDLTQVATHEEMDARIRNAAKDIMAQAQGRPVALRLELAGTTPLHAALLRDRQAVQEEVEAVLAGISDQIWLERLQLRTGAPARPAVMDPSTGGRIAADIRAAATPEALQAELDAILTAVIERMPAHTRREEMRAAILHDVPARARDLALSLVQDPEGRDDAHQ